tara:strand:- start:261 stop:821 length:561 start_codon:yes stop_codon:yes gene_type:complete
MSKKSRRRNRRLLMMAALAGSAALAGRKGTAFPRPKKGTIDQMAADAAADAAGDSVITGTKYPGANKVVAAPKVITGDEGSNFQSRFKAKGGDGTWRGPGQILAERRLTAGNQIPPSMRGGAETAQGFVRKVPIKRTGRGRDNVTYGWTTEPYKKSWFSKGGRVKKARVTGIAKRGFGRALMKGKK